jgi:hypothetical protein
MSVDRKIGIHSDVTAAPDASRPRLSTPPDLGCHLLPPQTVIKLSWWRWSANGGGPGKAGAWKGRRLLQWRKARSVTSECVVLMVACVYVYIWGFCVAEFVATIIVWYMRKDCTTGVQ